MTVEVFDTRNCSLGEGPMWHPLRNQLFWFDINNKKMLSRIEDKPLEWQFNVHVSAAGWVSEGEMLITKGALPAKATPIFKLSTTISIAPSARAVGG